jgi:hypothetical protein
MQASTLPAFSSLGSEILGMNFLLYPLLKGYFSLLDSLLSLVAIVAEDGIYRELCTQVWNSSIS